MTITLYDGEVFHQRLRPVRHHFCYRLPWFLIELTEMQVFRPRFFGIDRFNLFSFQARDHGAADCVALAANIRGMVEKSGVNGNISRLRVLCMPRVLAWVFNPLTVYFCGDENDCLQAIVYEVSNTFGQRHHYVLAAPLHSDVVEHSCGKAFFVSPFMEMALRYEFRVNLPAQDAELAIAVSDAQGVMFHARFCGGRKRISYFTLLLLAARFPFLAFQVLAAIHWEALKLWCKGMRMRPLPVSRKKTPIGMRP